MSKTAYAAAIAVVLCASPALALEVSTSTEIAAAPATVWKTIGDFCGIGQWHPAVEKCVLSEKAGKSIRTLSLKGGATLVEEQLARNDGKMSYSYSILEGPLPVANYKSTIMVAPNGSGSKVTWSGDFAAKGADDAKAKEVILGIYEAGLKSIAAKSK